MSHKNKKSVEKFAAALASRQAKKPPAAPAKPVAPPPTPVTKFVTEEKTVVTAPTVEAVGLSEWEVTELEQLQFIADYGQVTIPQFRQRFDTGINSRPILDQLMETGFVERTFSQGSGRYQLTSAGKERAAALQQILQPNTQ